MNAKWILAAATLALAACDSNTDGGTTQPPPDETVEPTLDVSADVKEGIAPLELRFSAKPTGLDLPITWAWTFGDGGTSTERAPTHVYATAGDFDARVRATDADGDQIEGSVTIRVTPATVDTQPTVGVEADFDAGTLDVSFLCNAAGGNPPLSFAWSFGDDTTGAEQNPLHSYPAGGTYTATCTVTDADGDEAAASIDVELEDLEAVIELPDGACAEPGVPVRLDGRASKAAAAHAWVFLEKPMGSSAGLQGAGSAEASFTPDLPGLYRVILSVTSGAAVDTAEMAIGADETPDVTLEGSGQEAAVEQAFGAPVVATVVNGCGRPLAGRPIRWTANGVGLSATETVTDAAGQVSVSATAGTRAGNARISAHATGGYRTDGFLVVLPGEPALLITEPVPSRATISETQGIPVEFQVTDAFGNDITDSEATFHLDVGAEAHLDSATGVTGKWSLTTVEGRHSEIVYATMAHVAEIAVTIPDGSLRPVSRQVFLKDDFESGSGSWTFSGDWEQGAPAVGPNVPHSGASLLGTRLGAPHSMGNVSIARHDVSMPMATERALLRFWHWRDTVVEDEACATGGGVVLYSGAPVLPAGGWGGYPVCGHVGGPTDTASGFFGWEKVELELAAMSSFVAFELFAADEGVAGAGWYLDDVEIEGIVGAPASIEFAAGAPARALATTVSDGTVCGTSAVVEVQLQDAGGNDLAVQGVEVDLVLDGMAVVGDVLEGALVSGGGTQLARVATDATGSLRVEIDNVAQEQNVITAMMPDVVGSDTMAAMNFASCP